jgi:hypothetical protein
MACWRFEQTTALTGIVIILAMHVSMALDQLANRSLLALRLYGVSASISWHPRLHRRLGLRLYKSNRSLMKSLATACAALQSNPKPPQWQWHL